MELALVRTTFTDASTIGELSLDGTRECHTLEDRVRPQKIAKETAIPEGRYEVVINESPRFKRRLPLLMNVPGYTGVRIHSGNTASDTEGCILVGKTAGKDRIGESRLALKDLLDKLEAAVRRKETIWITITSAAATDLLFDGRSLTVRRGGQRSVSWPAVSGRPGYQNAVYQILEGKGPLPAGKWIAKQSRLQAMPERGWMEKVLAELGRTAWPGGESAWGRYRVWLEPLPGTQTYGRSGFSIHGGEEPGSAGCIDLTHHITAFVHEFRNAGTDLELTVDYR